MRRLLLLASLLACAPPQGRDSFVLTVALWGPLGQLRPTGHDEGGLASIAAPWVFDRVGSIDRAGNLTPAFATAIDRQAGGRVRITLGRQGTFSDGSAVTHADIVRSLTAQGLQVESQEPATLIAFSIDPARTTEAALLHASISREVNGRFLGSGPFMVAGESDHELRLVRRTSERGRVNEVRLAEYPTARDALLHTLKGDANLMFDVEARQREFFDGVPHLRVLREPGHNADAVMFNTRLSRAERVALVAALSSEQVRELAYGPGECAESREARPQPRPIPAGPPLNVISWGTLERLGMAVRRALGERGGEVQTLAPQEVLARMQSHQFDLVLARPLMWPPSTMSLLWHTGGPDNTIGYSNKLVDAALDAGDWAAAEAALREDPPAAFICTRDKLAVVDARIKNPMLGPWDILETLPQWEVMEK